MRLVSWLELQMVFLIMFAVLQVVLLIFFATSSQAIIAIDAIVGGVGLIVHEMIYFNTDESMLRGAGAQFATVLRRITHRGQGAE